MIQPIANSLDPSAGEFGLGCFAQWGWSFAKIYVPSQHFHTKTSQCPVFYYLQNCSSYWGEGGLTME